MKDNETSLVLGHPCPNCTTFIGPGIHPHDKKSFSSMQGIWHLVCEECSYKFDVPESKLYFVSVSKQWLREHHSFDLEAMILAGETQHLSWAEKLGCGGMPSRV